MQRLVGDLFHPRFNGSIRVITTNGTIGHFGLVMGRGVAKIARDRNPGLSWRLAERVKDDGLHVVWDRETDLVAFPVKWNFWERADLDLIRVSCYELVAQAHQYAAYDQWEHIYLPLVGAGNGHRRRDEVLPILEKELADDRFTLVEYGDPTW